MTYWVTHKGNLANIEWDSTFRNDSHPYISGDLLAVGTVSSTGEHIGFWDEIDDTNEWNLEGNGSRSKTEIAYYDTAHPLYPMCVQFHMTCIMGGYSRALGEAFFDALREDQNNEP